MNFNANLSIEKIDLRKRKNNNITKQNRNCYSPEHLNSWSCRSAMFCPLRWLGEWHLVYCPRRGECLKYRASQDNWQSQCKRFSLKRNVRNLNMLLNMSFPSHVRLLLFNVLRKSKLPMIEWMFMWKTRYNMNHSRKSLTGFLNP